MNIARGPEGRVTQACVGFQQRFVICKGSEVVMEYHLKYVLVEYQRILHKRERTAAYIP